MLKDVSSKKVALWVLFAVWLFIAGVVVAGNVSNQNPTQESFEVPTPVSVLTNSKLCEYNNSFSDTLVLVLDKQEARQMAILWFICMDLDVAIIIRLHILSPLLVDAWQHCRR